jgi:hypothetical protein
VSGLVGWLSSGLIGRLIVGLIGCYIVLLLPATGYIVSVLLLSLLIWLIGGFQVDSKEASTSREGITLVETMSWNWMNFGSELIPGLALGGLAGMGVGTLSSLGSWLFHGLTGGLIGGISSGLVGRLFGGLLGGLGWGLWAGLEGGFTYSTKVDKASPNQGINLSRKNSLFVFLIASLATGLSSGLIFGMLSGWSMGLTAGLIFGLIGGLLAGLRKGGSAVVKHYLLRLILWINGYTMQLCRVSRSLCQADSAAESRRRLHLRPPGATKIFC